MEIVIALAIVGFLALTTQAWMLLLVHRQHARIRDRIEDVARRHVRTTAADTISRTGIPAPSFDLAGLDGERTTLAQLLTARRPLVLVFTDPRCGPCIDLLPDVGGWQRVYEDRLTVALVSTSDAHLSRAMTAEYSIDNVLLQEGQEVVDAFGATMAPAAIVVRPDGRVGSDVVYGAQAVRQLVADTLGLAMPDQPARHLGAVSPGDAAPSIRRPDLDGNVVELAAQRPDPVLLLFWNPGCTHCQELLPDIRAWERDAHGPGMIVVSRGAAALNLATGLRSPIVLDDDHSVADRFGVSGTPAGVIIDASGIIASDIARGATAVRALATPHFPCVSSAAD